MERAIPRARFALVLAIVLYALFGVLDALIAPTDATKIWVIRYAIVCPIGVGVLGLTFSRRFRPILQPTLAGFALIVGLGIVAMVAVTDASVGYVYYAGLLLVIPWVFTLLQLRFPYATGACLIIIAAYEVVAIWVEHTPIEILINNNFFLISAGIVGMVAGYTIEAGTRTAFVQRRLIESQRAELADRNVELDSALRASLDEVRQQAEELRASRARIVVTADVERRRIERNLHDGAQQQLIALALRLSVAESLAGPNEEQRRLSAPSSRQRRRRRSIPSATSPEGSTRRCSPTKGSSRRLLRGEEGVAARPCRGGGPGPLRIRGRGGCVLLRAGGAPERGQIFEGEGGGRRALG